MPVTVVPGDHQPKAHPIKEPSESVDHFFKSSCRDAYIEEETNIVASSYCNIPGAPGTFPFHASESSFFRSVIEAWSYHSHLVIRPEDIWFTILIQMNFFIGRNAQSIRHLFTDHYGKYRLPVPGNRWENVIHAFQDRVKINVKAPWLNDWIFPGFSTSTDDDYTTAIVLMMGLIKPHIEYGHNFVCGIPSITVLGTKQDWHRIIRKVERLHEFGAEPADYAQRMRPLLSRIMGSFDNPRAANTREFWDQMVQAKVEHCSSNNTPPNRYIVSGWMLGFCYWDYGGRPHRRFSKGITMQGFPDSLIYDNCSYGSAPLEDLPIGYAKSAFTIWTGSGESKREFHGWILAGHIGKSIKDGMPKSSKLRTLRYNQTGTKAAKDGAEQCGCLSTLLRDLNCFGSRQPSQEERGFADTDENADIESRDQFEAQKNFLESAQSTIQPLSGWFLVGPDKETGPLVWGETEEWGDTVDAIESCETIEHCHR